MIFAGGRSTQKSLRRNSSLIIAVTFFINDLQIEITFFAHAHARV
jgi:hypothetical protein